MEEIECIFDDLERICEEDSVENLQGIAKTVCDTCNNLSEAILVYSTNPEVVAELKAVCEEFGF